MVNTPTINFAGDVEINNAIIQTPSGISLDIKNQILGINIFEDIFSPFITGEIYLHEALDLTDVMPLIGQESLILDIETPSLENGNIHAVFHVFKMTDMHTTGDKSVAYKLHFVSPESYFEINKKISKVFSGNVSDIVRGLLNDINDGMPTDKQLVIENTIRPHKFISNYWSPISIINYLKNQAISEDRSSSYLFYENRDGFNFRTINSLVKQPVHAIFEDNVGIREKTGNTDTRNIQHDFENILEIKQDVPYNFYERLKDGVFSSKVIGFDLHNKTYNERNYNIRNYYDEIEKLNKHPHFVNNTPIDYTTRQKTYNWANEVFDNLKGNTTNFEIIQKRMSEINLLKSNTMMIKVNGRFDYTAGMKVSLKLPKMNPIRETDTPADYIDDRFSGEYIATSVNHIVSLRKHECEIKLMSNSINRDPNNA